MIGIFQPVLIISQLQYIYAPHKYPIFSSYLYPFCYLFLLCLFVPLVESIWQECQLVMSNQQRDDSSMQKYEILGIIGQGAYGVVLKCRAHDSQEVLAVKKFKESEEDQAVRKTTAREVKVLKMLKHPNVVELREAFRKKGVVYLVFEFVQSNLLEVLQRSPGGLDPELIRLFLYQLLKGLAHMHAHHLLHRDIKPENLLVSDRKELKICDFGFARQAPRGEEELTDYVATRWYRPPELLVGVPYGREVDLWAAGCIMAELVDGNPLFPGQNELDQLYLIQKTLGKLAPDHEEAFRKNPRFLGMRFPEIHNLDTLDKKYIGKLSPKALNFLKQLLRMAPADRLSASEALRHPYFDGLREDDLLRKPASNSHLRQESKLTNSITPGVKDREDDHRRRASNVPYHNHPSEGSNPANQFNRSTKANLARKGREEMVRLINTKGFQQTNNYSKSVNKPKQHQNVREKNISLQKHQNRDVITKTQTGFYILTGGGVIEQQRENNPSPGSHQSRSRVYKRSPKNKQSQKGKSLLTHAVQISQEDEFWQSSSQLPSIIASQQQGKGAKGTVIMMANSTFNHKTYH